MKNYLRMAAGTVKRWLYRSNSAVWFCCALTPRQDALPAGCSIEFNDFEGALAFLKRQAGQFPWILVPKEVDAARRWGHHYGLICSAGQVAGYIKVARRRAYVEDFDREMPLKEDEAFICDTYIAPEFRGEGLSKVLAGATASWLQRHGVRYLFCHIPEWNAASLALYRGLGFREIRKISHVRMCGLRFYSARPEAALTAGRSLHG
ncbi:MAG TPA: GNAT family N-acetyltransferase [Geomonas sp.]|nr:GNAT family N-acetyltransferase [Geomonas sp.]